MFPTYGIHLEGFKNNIMGSSGALTQASGNQSPEVAPRKKSITIDTEGGTTHHSSSLQQQRCLQNKVANHWSTSNRAHQGKNWEFLQNHPEYSLFDKKFREEGDGMLYLKDRCWITKKEEEVI